MAPNGSINVPRGVVELSIYRVYSNKRRAQMIAAPKKELRLSLEEITIKNMNFAFYVIALRSRNMLFVVFRQKSWMGTILIH